MLPASARRQARLESALAWTTCPSASVWRTSPWRTDVGSSCRTVRRGAGLNELLQLVLTSLLFGAIGAASPTRTAVTVLMLTTRTRPWARAVAYGIGSTLVFAVAALLGLIGGEQGGQRDPGLASVVVGTILVIVAAAMLVIRRRRSSTATVDSGHPLISALGVGLGVSLQAPVRLVILVAGGTQIALIAGISPVAIMFGLLMLVTCQVPIWGTMLVAARQPDRFTKLEERARPVLDRVESGPVGAVLVGLLGIALVLRGLLA